MVVINCFDGLRNVKGWPLSNVTPRILFLSHLMRRDDATCFVATCHVLIGWTWARSTTGHLVFPCLDFWEAFKSFSLSSLLSISTMKLHFCFELPFLCFFLPLCLGRFGLLLLKYDFCFFLLLEFPFPFLHFDSVRISSILIKERHSILISINTLTHTLLQTNLCVIF